jgi:DDB1- and CUL4-associated factor 7
MSIVSSSLSSPSYLPNFLYLTQCIDIAWAPHSPNHISTAAEDRQALIWDINMRNQVEDPVLAYTAEGEINQLQWSIAHEDYIGISYDDSVQFLKV